MSGIFTYLAVLSVDQETVQELEQADYLPLDL